MAFCAWEQHRYSIVPRRICLPVFHVERLEQTPGRLCLEVAVNLKLGCSRHYCKVGITTEVQLQRMYAIPA